MTIDDQRVLLAGIERRIQAGRPLSLDEDAILLGLAYYGLAYLANREEREREVAASFAGIRRILLDTEEEA